MAFQVVSNAICQCAMGVAPSPLGVLPANKVSACYQPAANIMDNKLGVNVKPFAMCNSLSNPATALATSLAAGVLTPTPCTPILTAPWAPGASKVMISTFPSLDNNSVLMCAYAGVIKIQMQGEFTVMIS